jgi:hypothetical protein
LLRVVCSPVPQTLQEQQTFKRNYKKWILS